MLDSLEKELKVVQKVPKQPPLLNRIENTRAYVERAGKRLEKLAAQRIEIEKQEAVAKKEMEEAKGRLEAMEIEARTDLAGVVPVHRLEEAVKSMLELFRRVSFTDLPPGMIESVAQVHTLLDKPDGRTETVEIVNESEVPSGRLDMSLEEALMTDAPPDEDSDEALLMWARDQQRKRARCR